MKMNIPPCFYCERPSEYVALEVEEVTDNSFKVVDVCKDHFVFSGVS